MQIFLCFLTFSAIQRLKATKTTMIRETFARIPLISIINGYGFPIVTEHAISLRELEIQNYEKFTCSLFKAQGLDA